ncbi:MFS transporter [Asanoa ishikariensis]|uniref:Major Facilitator Superfamily protein n=1 Tax=Asanoa ishikariensis TaxID=137265 RepID=A0A1H3TUC3_9ACTN|nr:MFS transporter [Asanoa ishikariensis]GIF67477.1 MFS transporter [Asanoa ishikariensis]SDZ53637.1 Major Facilitator Superfamily protein [Asanoa ishikariensis]
MATAVQARLPGTVGDRGVRLTIALAVLGVFVTYVPITAVSVSLTTIGTSTGGSTADLQWVTDSYIIPMAATILSAGVFGDLHGRRRVFLTGMAITVLGAAIAMVAGTVAGGLHLLWVGQAVTGAGAGLLLPTTLALIAHAVPDLRARARYIALWATGLVLGLAAGPLISGTILRYAGWGWIFVPIIALALVAGLLAALRLPESKSPQGRRLDWPGQITATVAIAASIFGVIEGGQAGWGAPTTIAGLVVGVAALAVFLRVEARSTSPILQLSLFRLPAFRAASFSALAALFAIVGGLFLLSLFFGAGQHLSPLEIGVRLLFVNGVTAVANPFVGRLLAHRQPITLLAVGLGLGAVAMLLLTGLGTNTSFVDVAWRLAILGVADAFMLSAVAVAAIHAVPHHLAGMAAAANTAVRQYGGALGPAVLGVILSSRMAGGASMVSALHTALIVNAVVLLVAAAVCVVTVTRRAPTALS